MEYNNLPNSTRPEPIPTPIIAIKHVICYSCWKPSPLLKKCAACKRVSYCSQQCQKHDWNSSHKKTCKFLVASNKQRVPISPTGRTWEVYFDEKVRPLRICRWFLANKSQSEEVGRLKAQSPGYNNNWERLLLWVSLNLPPFHHV
jgi:hypothetical protein